jgi:hypothetical protein
MRGLDAGQVVELTLPSGTKIMARRPSPSQLFTWGIALHKLNVFGEPPGQPLTTPQVETLAPLVFELLSFVYVKPRLSLLPRGNDEISLTDVPVDDCSFMMRWALGQEGTPNPADVAHNHTREKHSKRHQWR